MPNIVALVTVAAVMFAVLHSQLTNVCTVPCPSTVLANKNALKHKKIQIV